jgi:hypothetical protein
MLASSTSYRAEYPSPLWRRPRATLLNGGSYFNRGLHVITLRWGKVHAIEVFEDSQEVARGLAVQAAGGADEAVAEQIVS